MYRCILVPLDGSKTAEGVLPHAKALASAEGAELVLLRVAANPALEFSFSDPAIAEAAINDLEEQAKTYMDAMSSELRTEGFHTTPVLRDGSVADVILSVAEEFKVDMIAMSTHGRSGPARWLLGSVAERVVRSSRVPVLLVRAQQ